MGHATVLIELGGVRLLTDPVLRDRFVHLRRHAPPVDPGVAKRLEGLLISHLHLDHLDLPSLRRVEGRPRLLAPAGSRAFLARHGFRDMQELRVGESAPVGGLEVTAVAAKHDGRRWPLGAHAQAIGFVVRGGRSVYFAGDTDLHPGMAEMAGAHDVALLPVWGWGPALGEGHMDPRRAAQAVALLRPRLAIPIHWGTFYPRGLAGVRGAPLREPPRVFAAHVAELAPEVEVRVLEPGESTAL